MSVVLDASALLALLNDEPGSDIVEASLSGAVISAVNWAEVVSKLCEKGMPPEEAEGIARELDITISPLTAQEATLAGALRPLTRAAGLSLGDRCCLALAKRSEMPCMTAERAWANLAGSVGLEIRQIR